MANKPINDWSVYIIRCADQSLYTGVTTDINRRIAEHNSPDSITRYTRVRQPVSLVYHETLSDRSSACKREHQIKKLSRLQKLTLVQAGN